MSGQGPDDVVDPTNGPSEPNAAGPGDLPPPPASPPPAGGWPPPPGPSQPQAAWQQPAPQPVPQQIVVKQGPGCLKIGLIVAAVLVLFGVLGVACLAMGANEVAKEIDKSMGAADPADFDITVKTCELGTIGPEATGTITNTSDKRQGFQVEIRFTNQDGNLISEDSTFGDALDPGQTGTWDVTALGESDGVTKLTCSEPEVSYHIFDDEGD